MLLVQSFNKVVCLAYSKSEPKSIELLNLNNYVEIAVNQKYVSKIFEIR